MCSVPLLKRFGNGYLTSIDVLFLALLLEIYGRIFNRLQGSKSNIMRFYIYTSPAVIIIFFYDITRRNGPYKMCTYMYMKIMFWTSTDTSCTQMRGRMKKKTCNMNNKILNYILCQRGLTRGQSSLPLQPRGCWFGLVVTRIRKPDKQKVINLYICISNAIGMCPHTLLNYHFVTISPPNF